MAKEKQIIENVINTPLNDLISERYGDYAKYIIQERALPDARDGLKPVQRRILYAMYKDGNTSDKAFRKSAKTVGLVIGNYHPHGDSSVYEAMVHLSQSWKINYPLVDMHGNNGSIDDDPAAAMRYTEARLAKIAETLLEDIDKETVIWTPNFDDTENEPTVLPAKYPNLLVNGSTGIASGYATSIPPHNLGEICDGAIYRIVHPDCSLDSLMKIVKGPDFPTGGIVQGKEQIRQAFETGKGKVVVRSKATIEKTKTVQQIIVTEIPYEVIKVNIVKKIDEIRFNKDIDGIVDVRDESDRKGLKIVIDVHKDADAQMILNYLYKNTELQVNYNYNMVAIVNNRPCQLGLIELLDAYISFAQEVILKRSKYEFKKRMDRCHILEGLIKAVSVMDEVIKIIRSSKDKANAKQRLIERFSFTEIQAEAIVTLRLYRLTNTDVLELKNEYGQLVAEAKDLNEIINNRERLDQVLCKQLTIAKKDFGHERLSQLEDEVDEIKIDKMSMIANEKVAITLSRDGYIKRVSMRSYNASENTPTGLKDEDELIGVKEVDTYDTILAFSSSGEYVSIPIYTLSESKWKDVGQHISNYVRVNNNEKFVDSFIVKTFDSYCYVVTATAKGMIKKTGLKQWQLQRTSKSSSAINLTDDDYVISTKLAYANDEIYLLTKDGYGNRFSIEEIPEVGVKAKGVKSMKLASDDVVVNMAVISQGQSEMVFLTSKGNSKRIKVNDLPVTKRASKGLLIAKKNKTNPFELKYCLCGCLNDDLALVVKNEKINLKFREVNLLDADSRFSAISYGIDYYHLAQIDEAKIIDYPPEEKQKSYEEFTLEV